MVQRLTSVAQPARAFTTSDPAEWTALDVVPSARGGVPLWTAPPSNDPTAIVTAEGDTAIVAPSASQLFLERPLAIDTLGVDRARLAVDKDVFDSVELCWAAAGQPFADERCSFQSVSEPAPGALDFELAKEPFWTGTVDRLAVRWTIAGKPPRLGPLTLLAESAATAATPIPDGAARAELRGISRGVWVAPAGSERTISHETGSGERLRFAYGASETRRGALRFTLDAIAGGVRFELFTGTVAPRRTPDDPGWREAEVDLGRFAGQTIELRFAVAGSAPESDGGDGGVAYWGSVEITAPAPERDSPRPNVVLISIDTLRADRMSLYGYERQTTPRLDAWARSRAAVFRDVTAAAPWTLPSHVSLFSGKSALVHGVNRLGPIPPSLPLLAERFAAAGYRTRATTAGAMTAPHFGFARGFDEYRVRVDMRDISKTAGELDLGIAEARRFLGERRDEPFLLFFHTYEVHTPYDLRQPYFDRFGGAAKDVPGGSGLIVERQGDGPGFWPEHKLYRPGRREDGRWIAKEYLPLDRADLASTIYDASIAYTDERIGELLALLDETGLAANTIVALVSDHGESFGEHGLLSHFHLYEDNLHVPLVLAAPGVTSRSGAIAAPARLYDLAPTLLELAGLAPFPGTEGRSLVPLLRGESDPPRDAWAYCPAANSGIALKRAGRKFLAFDAPWQPLAGRLESYDLRADPRELHDLGATAEANQFLELAHGRLSRDLPALSLAFRNSRDLPLLAVLEAPLLGPQYLSATLPRDSASTLVYSPAGIRVSVAAGEELSLRILDRTDGTLRVQLVSGGASSVAEIPLGDPDVARRLRWREHGRFVDEPSGERLPDGSTGVALRRQGRRIDRPAATGTSDAERIRELKALGYLR